jgi:hypothetical protein
MFGNHLNFPRTNLIEQTLGRMSDVSYVIQFKKSCTALHGMKQPEYGVHGFAVTVDGLKNGAGAALFSGRGMRAGLIPSFHISGMQPARQAKRSTVSSTSGIGALLSQPAVDSLTTLPELYDGRLELVQHLSTFQKKFINNFSLFRQ